MSVEHMAVVLHHSRAKGTAKLVLLGIANHAGDGGAWPAVATLAKYANVHERNVQRAIESLIALRELRVAVQSGGLGPMPDWSRPNRYDVTLACPAHCDRTPHHRDTRNGGAALLWPLPADADDVAAVRAVDLADSVDNLLINRVANPPPGGASATPPGGAGATLTTITNPATPGPALTTDPRPCDDCGHPEAECIRRQARWSPTDRHSYRPHVRPPPRGVT